MSGLLSLCQKAWGVPQRLLHCCDWLIPYDSRYVCPRATQRKTCAGGQQLAKFAARVALCCYSLSLGVW